jgi:hypothetical protein
MSMIIVLGMCAGIVNIARRVVVPLVKFAVAAKNFTDDVGVAFLENAVAFQNPRTGAGHRF